MLSGVLSVIDGGCKIASSHSPLAVTEVELGVYTLLLIYLIILFPFSFSPLQSEGMSISRRAQDLTKTPALNEPPLYPDPYQLSSPPGAPNSIRRAVEEEITLHIKPLFIGKQSGHYIIRLLDESLKQP